MTTDGPDLNKLKKDYIVSSLQSSYGLYYLCLSPKSAVLHDVILMQRGVLGVILLLLLAALFLSFRSAAHNSRYVGRMLSASCEPRGNGNIYQTLDNAFRYLIRDNIHLRELRDDSMGSLRKQFFSRLLTGGFSRPYDMQIYADDIGLSLSARCRLLMYSAEWERDSVSRQEVAVLRRLLDQWCGILIEHIGKGYIVPLELGRAAVILDEHADAQKISLLLLEAAGTLRTEDPIGLRCCITPQSEEFSKLPELARTCCAALGKAGFSRETENTVLYPDPPPASAHPYALTDRQQSALFEAVRAGDFAAANECFTALTKEVILCRFLRPLVTGSNPSCFNRLLSERVTAAV